MKVTKAQLKKMVREAVREQLQEIDRGDFELHQQAQVNDVVQQIKSADIPHITRQKMDQVLDVLLKKATARRVLSAPGTQEKIKGALDAGQYDALANGLEKLAIKTAKQR
jgi:hypothetical protein